uniref:Zona pellucida sperm-binding protein 3 n=1 Tax=Megalamphodus bentosi TaxID=711523 RepID=A0A7R6VNJ9_9TELE|nr:egg envelope protein [Hyphessobrycon bentosi]
MGLGQAGVWLLVFALMAFCEAQRRTWKTEGASGAFRAVAGHQPTVRKPVPARHGLQSPAQTSVRVRPQPNFPPGFHDLLDVQLHQLLQVPEKKVTWRFPKVPLKPSEPPVPFQMREPVSANSVAVQCGENGVYVEVKQDFFGTGLLLMPSAITLGGCGPTGQDVSANVLLFQSELHDCNSVLTMTEDELIYSFVIYAAAEPLSDTPIIREDAARVDIECHYSRKKNVSSNALQPTWIPFAATKVAEEQLIFSLRLMTDDWKYERPSSRYYLGDIINIEASVIQFNHVPLRVLVDRCVAIPFPELNAVPNYSVIKNPGCLVDAKITGSRSPFMAQDQGDKVQFQLETFRFYQDRSGFVYITCYLMATEASAPSDSENKACSYSGNRWTAAFGEDRVCCCCDTSCSLKGREVSPEEHQVEMIALRPLFIEDDPVDAD